MTEFLEVIRFSAEIFYRSDLLTNIKFPLPVIRPPIETDLEIHPALGLSEGGHDARGAVLVDHDAVRVLGVKSAGDAGAGDEAGPRQVDHGAAQHVAVLRRKHEGEISLS